MILRIARICKPRPTHEGLNVKGGDATCSQCTPDGWHLVADIVAAECAHPVSHTSSSMPALFMDLGGAALPSNMLLDWRPSSCRCSHASLRERKAVTGRSLIGIGLAATHFGDENVQFVLCHALIRQTMQVLRYITLRHVQPRTLLSFSLLASQRLLALHWTIRSHVLIETSSGLQEKEKSKGSHCIL